MNKFNLLFLISFTFLATITEANDDYEFLNKISPDIAYQDVLPTANNMYKNMRLLSCEKTELKVSQNEMEKILNFEEFAIICAWPKYLGHGKALNQKDIKRLHSIMERYFACKKLRYIRADGFYNGHLIKDTYIVLNANEETETLARHFSQYSLLLANKGKAKLVFFKGPQKGKYSIANNWSIINSNNQDHTSVKILDSKTPFKFTWNFDDILYR